MEAILGGISVLFAFVFVIGLAGDIIKTALIKLKNEETEHKWNTTDLFQSMNSWAAVLIMGILLFYGIYTVGNEYARIKSNEATGDMTYCEECDTKVPSKYTNDVFGNWVCPDCAYAAYKNDLEWYQSALEVSPDNGAMIVEVVVCDWCGWYAPDTLFDKDGNFLCIDCITEALQDGNVARAVWNYFEYG